jgi:hypothetical protein
MTKFLVLLLTFLTVIACTSSHNIPAKRDKTHIAPHGGVVVKGDVYFLEIVGGDHHVHLYPLQEAEDGTLVTIPMKNVKIVAEYSPERSKADYSLNLRKRHEHYYGKVDPHGESTYQVHVDMKVGKTKEEFLYNLRTKDLKKKHDL